MNSEIGVYVCGLTEEALSFWTDVFEVFFGGCTTVSARGSWQGETEAVNVVSHLFDKYDQDFDDQELVALVKRYKSEQQQDAVLVTYTPVYANLW